MTFSVHTYFNSPSNPEEWNHLAESNGNYFQSTYSDLAQAYYRQTSAYIEAKADDKLVGGVRIYQWESKRWFLRSISRTTIQLGEMLTAIDINSSDFITMKAEIKKHVLQFLKQSKATEYATAGIYGNEALLFDLENLTPSLMGLFNASYVNLDRPIKDVIAGFNRNTQRNIKKAEVADLVLTKENDIEEFLKVLNVVYAQQNPPREPPNNDYIRNIFKTLAPLGVVDVHLIKQNGEAISSAFFVKMGANAHSWFGGSVKNDIGAGQYIYLELMKKYQQEGIKRFYFGEVVRESDDKNEKFSKGISGFKRGFGVDEINSFKKTYTLIKSKKMLWDLLVKMRK